MRRPRFRILIYAVIGGVVALNVTSYIVVECVLPYSIICPHRIHSATVTSVGAIKGIAEPFDFTVETGIELKGWFIHACTGTPLGTVIVLHGIASCKEDMLGFAEYLSKCGFNVIAYDARAHGESGGEYCTYGYYEHLDVSRAIDEIQHRYRNPCKIAVFGSSYGGAVALQAMAHDPRIACGVVESPFATLGEVVHDYGERLFGFMPRSLSDHILSRAGRIAHFGPDSVKPEEAARIIYQPVLLIHGTADRKISIQQGKRIFRLLASSQKQWVPIPGGTHLNLWKADPQRYLKEILEFLKKWTYDQHRSLSGSSCADQTKFREKGNIHERRSIFCIPCQSTSLFKNASTVGGLL